MQAAYTVYPLANYSFGSKDRKTEKDGSMEQKMARLKTAYERDGMRRSVEGIIMVQEHNHPHVLLLQLTSTFFKLPGGRLRPGEDEVEGLRRKLKTALTPAAATLQMHWDIAECAGIFWRPHWENQFYPYVPPHVTRPKEQKKLFIVPLPDKALFAVPKNMRLVAVPLFELYDNMSRYGPVIASIPLLLSRLRLNLVQVAPSPSLLPAGGTQQPSTVVVGSGGKAADEHR